MWAFNYQTPQMGPAMAIEGMLRPTLGDTLVKPVLSALRAQLRALHTQLPASMLAGRAPADRTPTQASECRPTNPATRTHTPVPQGIERKQVTVLFADLVDFTAISERHDAEVIHELQSDLFEQMADVVHQHEGFVEKFVGDAIMVVFGAPMAHDDDAERALRAALAMRERMALINRRWAKRLGSDLRLHIGINTGIVVAGYLRCVQDAVYMVTGDAVNTAARLQDLAQPGQILVGLDTFWATQAAFDFRPLEPLTVKGKREPLAAFELLRKRHVSSSQQEYCPMQLANAH